MIIVDAHSIDPHELLPLAKRCYPATALFSPVRWHVRKCKCHGASIFGTRSLVVERHHAETITMRIPLEVSSS